MPQLTSRKEWIHSTTWKNGDGLRAAKYPSEIQMQITDGEMSLTNTSAKITLSTMSLMQQ
jgi:hypothetical protein